MASKWSEAAGPDLSSFQSHTSPQAPRRAKPPPVVEPTAATPTRAELALQAGYEAAGPDLSSFQSHTSPQAPRRAKPPPVVEPTAATPSRAELALQAAGPDLSAEMESDDIAPVVKKGAEPTRLVVGGLNPSGSAATTGSSDMPRRGSFSSLWNWATSSPPVSAPPSRNNSAHGGVTFKNLFVSSPAADGGAHGGGGFSLFRAPSRDSSAHGGTLFGGKRQSSPNLQRPSGGRPSAASSRQQASSLPAEGGGGSGSQAASRDSSAHGGSAFAKPMKREGSLGQRLWAWATSDEARPDMSTFGSATSPSDERAKSPMPPGSPDGRVAGANSASDQGC